MQQPGSEKERQSERNPRSEMKKKTFSKRMTFRELPFFGHDFLWRLVYAPNGLAQAQRRNHQDSFSIIAPIIEKSRTVPAAAKPLSPGAGVRRRSAGQLLGALARIGRDGCWAAFSCGLPLHYQRQVNRIFFTMLFSFFGGLALIVQQRSLLAQARAASFNGAAYPTTLFFMKYLQCPSG